MAVNINLKLNADDSGVKKKLSDLDKAAKKGLNFGGGRYGTPTSTGKPSKAYSLLEKAMNDLAKSYKKEKQLIEKQGKARYAWEKVKSVGRQAEKVAGATAGGFHTGSSLLSRATSGGSEYAAGGFMNSVHDKISTVQDTYSKAKEGYSTIKEAYKGQKEERDDQGNITKPARKGGVAAAALAGIPVVGGLIGGIVGGIMKQVDDMGKEWTSVMASQRSTTAATGGYIGGGGGYFQNAEMAQARIAFNRTQGAFGNKSILKDSSATAFAAQQNIGIAQYTEQLGQIKENDKEVSTDFLRGAADINKMTGLKQGQFVAKLAQYSTSMKEAGFNKEGIKQFASLTGGLAQAGMKGERAFTVGQTLNEDVRKGVGGGVMSKLTLAKLMSQGKSYFEASQLMEEEGLQNKETRKAYGESLEMFSPEIRGQIMQGQVTRHEAGLLTGKALESKITPLSRLTGVTSNRSLEMTNERMSTVVDEKNGVGVAARGAAELGYRAGQAQLEAFKTLGPAFEPIIKLMEEGEKELFAGVKDLTKEIQGMMLFMQKAQKEGVMKIIGEEIGKNIKLPWSN